MNSKFDIRRNCVRIKAEIKERELQFRGSGVLYPLGVDVGYDYILTAQHILKVDRKKKLNAVLDKIGTIEIEVFEDGHFITYKRITKDNVSKSLLPIGEDFLIIRIDKSEKHFTPFFLADDLIEEKSMQLYGVSGEAQDIITRLDCKCVDSEVDLVNITSHVDNMDSLHGMSGGGVFAQNQPLMYGVLWKHAATEGEFHNVKITQTLEEKIKSQLTVRRWKSLNFIKISQCKQAMGVVYGNVFRDINDSILVNRNNTRFPLEARFVMPDFIDEVQNLYSDDRGEPEEKPVGVDPTNLYIKSSEIQEYSEQYLKEFYSQLNKTSNREIRIPATVRVMQDTFIDCHSLEKLYVCEDAPYLNGITKRLDDMRNNRKRVPVIEVDSSLGRYADAIAAQRQSSSDEQRRKANEELYKKYQNYPTKFISRYKMVNGKKVLIKRTPIK